jgi:hypothetical protein
MSVFEKYPPSSVMWAAVAGAVTIATHPLWAVVLVALVAVAWKLDGNT